MYKRQDQSRGTNVEAPLDTIKQAVAEVMEDLQAGQMAGFEAVVAVLREILSAVYGIEPVSYTHLDVYKRQLLHRVC